jgi:hypothetical protein
MKNAVWYRADGGTPIGATGTQVQASLLAILRGASDTPVKFGIRSSGEDDWSSTFKANIVQIGSSPGNTQLRIGLDEGTLSPPWGVIGTVSAGGGSWGATGTRAAVVTARNATGMTVASMEAKATVTALSDTLTWAWAPVAGATGYNVYRRDDPSGTYLTPSLIADNVAVTSVADVGTSPSAGAPPTENTTAGAGPSYGTAPTLGFGPVLFGITETGRWRFLWVKRIVGSSIPTSKYFGGIQLTEA